MSDGKLLSINECCEMLKVSRPTFDKMRKKHSLKEYFIGSRPRFSKDEINDKILSGLEVSEDQKLRPLVAKNKIEAISVCEFDLDRDFSGKILDIDRFILVDAFSVSSLLCKLIAESAEFHKTIFASKGLNLGYFQKINFWTHLQKFSRNSIEIDPRMFVVVGSVFPEIILPISQVSFKTAEKRYLEEIRSVLRTHGFSNEIGDYIGWTLGELADNSHTHSDSEGKVFISIERLIGNSHNFLQINILDMGAGIPTTLKKNVKYKDLSDEKALVMAFKSNVSSWGDEYDRGKGLTDILKIAFECNSFFRVESGGLAFMFYCKEEHREVKQISASTKTVGTRFSITLIDNQFRETKRSEVNKFLDEYLEKL